MGHSYFCFKWAKVRVLFLKNCETNYGGGFENVIGVKILGNLLAKLRKFLNLEGTAKVCRIYI